MAQAFSKLYRLTERKETRSERGNDRLYFKAVARRAKALRREGKLSGDEQEMKEACQLSNQSQQGIDEFPKDEDSSDDFGMAREMIDLAEI